MAANAVSKSCLSLHQPESPVVRNESHERDHTLHSLPLELGNRSEISCRLTVTLELLSCRTAPSGFLPQGLRACVPQLQATGDC